MAWEVEYTDEFERWWEGLTVEQQLAICAAVEILEEDGPATGRPLVDTLTGSRYPNMKELRAPGGAIRILFAFDPRRVAILLIGGNKSGQWSKWYERAIPLADRLYDEHLEELREEES